MELRAAGLARLLIFGNSGSGKSWLAREFGVRLRVAPTDLDTIHWEPGDFNVARDRQLAKATTRRIAERDAWIIEGVYGWLAQEAVSRATTVVWLDLPIEECLANLRRRGGGRSDEAFAALLTWAAAYSKRETSSSQQGHERIFNAFAGTKVRLSSREETARLLANCRADGPETRGYFDEIVTPDAATNG